MGISYRRRIRLGRGRTLNISNRGASVSQRIGRVSISSRGGITIRILPGLVWRIGGRK